jgi:hypothetical protein
LETDFVELTFRELVRIGQCASRSDFSRDWLGREQSYYRSVQCRDGSVSITAQAHLAAKLRDMGTFFERCATPSVAAAGQELLDLHSECLEALFQRVLWEAQCGQIQR